MAFDFFSQPTGPTIPVSLFGDAATAGTNVGKAVPTQLSAGLQGLQEGIQTGQKIAENQSDIQIKQAEVTKANLQNDILQLDHNVVMNNQELYARTKKNELEAAASKSEQALNDATNQDLISKALASKDQNAINGIYTNPSTLQTLLRNPEFADEVLGQASTSLTPENFSTAYKGLGYSKYQKYQLALADEQAKMAKALFSPETKNPIVKVPASFNQALDGEDLTNPEKMFGNVQVFQQGVKTYDSNGNIVKDIPDRPANRDELEKNPLPYEVFKNGKLVTHVSKQDADTYADANRYWEYNKNSLGQSIYGRAFNGTPALPPVNGVQGLGIATPKPNPQPTATPGIQTFESLGKQAAPTATPNPLVNDSIVQSKRQAFEQLAKNPPPGISSGTIEQQLSQRKALIDKGLAQLKQQNLAAQNASQDIQNLATSKATETPKEFQAPTNVPTPSEALSTTLKKDVSLSIEPQPSIKLDTHIRINTDPLTASEPAIVKGLIATESGGRRNAVSPTGVHGLMQVTKGTAASYGLNRDIPEENLLAGKLYLYDQMNKFNGNLRLALAAYNAGPGAIQDAIRSTQSIDWEVIKGHLKETLSPKKFREVSAYPDKVISASSQFLGSGNTSDLNFAYALDDNNLLQPVSYNQPGEKTPLYKTDALGQVRKYKSSKNIKDPLLDESGVIQQPPTNPSGTVQGEGNNITKA